jgi:lysophospholipase L1-like esterase
MKLRAALAAAAVALIAAAPAVAEPAIAGYPGSIASTGDSITRAFNTCTFPYVDCVSNSWSTGTSATVNTHYRRILAANPAISGRNYNYALTGADMADLNGQVQNVVSRGVAYVTIEMGANDVCADSEAGMTPVATYRAQLEQAMRTLSTGLPNARIFVASIPDIYTLWAIYKDSSSARFIWAFAGICQSMLARPLSTTQADVERRARVRQRNIDYNTQLSEVCAVYVHCRFDSGTVFNTAFVRSDVTTRDYFHPSVAGQTKLAAVTWSATFDFTDATPPGSSGSYSAGAVTLTSAASDLKGIEYRVGSAAWARYMGPVPLASGATIEWRAVDVNGNTEASKTLTAP